MGSFREYMDNKKRAKELAAKQAADKLAAKRRVVDTERMNTEMTERGPGYRAVERGAQEWEAGTMPPGYEGVRDVNTRELLDGFKSDAYSGEALQKLKGEAFGAAEDSPWVKMQMEKQALEESRAKDQTASGSAQGIAQAQANLMRQGGLSGGSRERMAMQGARDMMRSQQEVAGQGMGQRLGIQEQAVDRQADLLKKFGDAESSANEKNIGRQTDDITRSGLFDMERYKQQMAAYGAKQGADAQRAAGSGGKK